jgi:hypothetical protein
MDCNGLEVDEIIEKSKYWHYDNLKQTFYALISGETIAVAPATLDAKDPRISPVLRRMSHITQGNCAEELRVTITLWADPRPILTMISMETRNYLTQIHAFKGKNEWGHVCLEVSYHGIGRHKNGTEFATGKRSRRELHIAPNILEACYPGCMLRLECLIGIGLSGEALVAQVFCADVPDTLELPVALGAG